MSQAFSLACLLEIIIGRPVRGFVIICLLFFLLAMTPKYVYVLFIVPYKHKSPEGARGTAWALLLFYDAEALDERPYTLGCLLPAV